MKAMAAAGALAAYNNKFVITSGAVGEILSDFSIYNTLVRTMIPKYRFGMTLYWVY